MKSRSAFVLALCVFSTFSTGIDVRTIIQRSVAANQKDWRASPDYSYLERDRDRNGTKTYRVSLLLGSPYSSLIAVNGNPLWLENRERERQRLEQVTEQRESESPDKREERIRKYERDRERDHLMMEQLADAFDFTLLGEQKLEGVDVYVLSAKPRPGYQPPNLETKALTGMEGKLWIDSKTFQWVKVTAEVVHPVRIEGFLVRIEPGTRFELEKMPVADGLWLPRHFSMISRARIFFFFPRQQQEDETYFDYQRLAPNASSQVAPGESN